MTLMIKNEPLGTSTGKIVYGDYFPDIFHLPIAVIVDLFKSSGLLLFRGFEVTHDQMKAFSERFSSGSIRDYVRPYIDSDGFVHFVDAGIGGCPPHCEHAYSPFRPDLVWFCCAVPAAQGGETLFWDGVRVWEELSEETKQLFISKKIKYCHNITVDTWKRFMGSGATFADFKGMLNGLEGVSYQIGENQSVSIEYVCSSVVKTQSGKQDAFANSILALYPKAIAATFEDGSPIPDKVLNEILKVMGRLTGEILWQVGDLVMIDNSRFLHGRRAFKDSRRQIFSTLSNLNF